MALLDALAVAPELLQAVTLAQFGVEDVHHHITKIQYHPPAWRLSLVTFGTQSLFADAARHFLGNGFQLRLGVARAKNQVIRYRGDFADVENKNVFGFLVQCRFAAQFS